MKNWKLSKLQIQAFKAFEHISFDFNDASLVTLDGPNGYGKTTVFDAIELMLTGRISRISELLKVVMRGPKVNYSDNLYWNRKLSDRQIVLMAEFLDPEGQLKCFARIADIEDLTAPQLNRADNFAPFKLYSIKSFGSTEERSELPDDYFNSLFGKSFVENYGTLNYLHQGENSIILKSSTSERKERIEALIEGDIASGKISLCKRAEKRLSEDITSGPDTLRAGQLRLLIEEESSLISMREVAPTFASIATKAVAWNLEEPFPTLSHAHFAEQLNKLEILHFLASHKQELNIRIENERLDRIVSTRSQTVRAAVEVGKHLDRWERLSTIEVEIRRATEVESSIRSAGSKLTVSAMAELSKSHAAPDALHGLLVSRDSLLGLMNQRGRVISALSEAQEALDKALVTAVDESIWRLSNCPTCGHDWQSVDELRNAIQSKALGMSSLNDEDATSRKHISDRISQELDSWLGMIDKFRADKLKSFDVPLFESLRSNLEHRTNVISFNTWLDDHGITYPPNFTDNKQVLGERAEHLMHEIEKLKVTETIAFPEDWRLVIDEAFEALDQFQARSPQDFVDKSEYLRYTFAIGQRSTIARAKADLRELEVRMQAKTAVRQRIRALKNVLTKTQTEYASRTIAEIELIFHIYSGRLIQNHQRGLGLFIDRGDGKKLRFSTALESEHDAILSMSSGQVSAVSMAFFLSLNKVYSKTPFVLIDDPTQSLDEINIASLTDLLRCELRDRQLIVSSHEDNITSYMRYKFAKAGIKQKSFHVQSHIETNAN